MKTRTLARLTIILTSATALTACQPASSKTSQKLTAASAAAAATSRTAAVITASAAAASTTPPAPSTTAGTRAAGTAPTAADAILVAGSTLTGTAPPPGSCHARTAANGQPLPDPACTPGAIDAAVTQANISTTICRSGYTTTVRPRTSVTDAFKALDEQAYGIPSGELDHLIPLEIGGSSDAHNLWVEPGAIPNPKDTVENDLHTAVCGGEVPLATAQRLIATDWTTALASIGRVTPAPPATTNATTPAPTATTTTATPAALNCAASMSNAHPAQKSTTNVLITTTPRASVTVTAHYKSTNSSHTGTADAAGHATVPFDISRATIGFTVIVDVGASAGSTVAHCSTSFTPQ